MMDQVSAKDTTQFIAGALAEQAVAWPKTANELAVVDQDSYDKASELLKSIADLKDEIVNHHKEPKSKAKAAWDAIRAAENRMLDPLKLADGIIRSKLGGFVREQERIRREEEQRRIEEARKREEEIRLNTAIQAEKVGADAETVEEILEKQDPVSMQKTPETYKRAKGIIPKKQWTWKLINESKIPREYLVVNMKAINAVVRSLGDKTNIPGIEVFEDFNITVRRK